MPTVNELRNALKARGLSALGKKSELEARLNEALAQDHKKQGGTAGTKIASSPVSKRQKTQADATSRSCGEAIFDSFSGGADVMDPENTLAFCESLGIDPEATIAIGLSYCLKSPTIGTFERDRFAEGIKELKVTDLASLKQALRFIEKRTSFGGSEFENVYKFAFGWGCDPGIRNMKKEVAVSLWKLLVPKHCFALIDEWVQFWEESSARVVTKDEWLSFKRFVDLMKSSTKVIETDDAWPIAIDDFVDKLKKKGMEK